MNSIDITSEEPHEEDVNDLLQHKDFGSVLRKARETAGLSTADVADKLLISEDVIKAIDNSQADSLPAATFTQGYIRSYARMLNVDADDIINSYNQMVPDSKQVVTPQSVLPHHRSLSNAIFKFISISLLLIAVVTVFTWLYQSDIKFNTRSPVKSDATENASSTVNEPVETSISDSGISTTVDFIESPVPVVEENSVPVTQADTAVINQQVTSEEVSVVVEEPVVSSPAKDELILTAIEESWSEIEDSEGNRLYYQLLNKNKEVKLYGTAPFTVFLGNAPQVRIEVNNKIVDFEQLINRNSKIAKIEIDANSDVNRSVNR